MNMALTFTFSTPLMRALNDREKRFHTLLRTRLQDKRDVLFCPLLHFETLEGNVVDQPTFVYQHEGKVFIVDVRENVPDLSVTYCSHPDFVYVHWESQTLPIFPENTYSPMKEIPDSDFLFFTDNDVHYLFDMLRRSYITMLLPQNFADMIYTVHRTLMYCDVTFRTKVKYGDDTLHMSYALRLHANGVVERSFGNTIHYLGRIVIQ